MTWRDLYPWQKAAIVLMVVCAFGALFSFAMAIMVAVG